MAILGIISLMIGLIAFAFFRKWYNPITVFSVLWGFIFVLYSLKLIDYYDIGMTTFTAFFLQVFGFFIGGLLACKFSVRLDHKAIVSQENNTEEITLYYKVIYILCIISVIVLLIGTVDTIKNLMNGMTFYEMMAQDMIEENSATGIFAAIKIYVLFPTTYSISAITACDLMLNKNKKHWILLFFNILIIILYSLQHGARMMLIIFSISYIFAYLLSDKNDLFIKKMKKFIIVIVGLSILFSIFLSTSRGIELDKLMLSLYKYFSGCVPNLDYWIKQLSGDMEHTLGFTSFNGIISPVMILLDGVGLINSNLPISRLAGQYVVLPENISSIGSGIVFNAFVGHSYSFFADGGLFGVFFGNLLYAYIATNIFNIIQKKNDLRLKTIYILFMATICLSFTRFSFCQYHMALALVVCIFAYGRRKKDDNSQLKRWFGKSNV